MKEIKQNKLESIMKSQKNNPDCIFQGRSCEGKKSIHSYQTCYNGECMLYCREYYKNLMEVTE